MQIDKVRRILFTIPLLLIASLVVFSAPAFITLHEGIDVEDMDAEISMEGLFVKVDASLFLRSHFSYEVSDLTIDVLLIDPESESFIQLMSTEPQNLNPGQLVEYRLTERFFAPSLILMLYTVMAEKGATFHFDIEVSFGYMARSLTFDISARLNVSIADDGERISMVVADNTESTFGIDLSGLRESLRPDDTVMYVEGGGEIIDLSITNLDGTVSFMAHSSTGLSKSISTISASDDSRVIYNGKDLGLSPLQIQILLTVLDVARSIL